MENVVSLISPAVSVIMNCYNSAQYLAEAIDSVYAQTSLDWEIIFWDNCSTDNSAEIARRYDQRLRYFRGEKTIPLGHARNLAIEKARGTHIAFLDCDDIWLPTKLEKQLPLFNDFEVDLVYGNYYQINEDASKKQIGARKPQPRGNVFRRFLKYYPVNLQTVMVRKNSLEKLGSLFDPKLNMSEEYDLFMRLLYNGKADYLDMPVAKSRIHDSMMSLTKIDQYPVEYKYILKKLSELIPNIEGDYREELRYLRAKIGYWYASAEMFKGSKTQARDYLAPFRWHGFAFFVLYYFTFFPRGLWLYLQKNRKRFLI